MGQLCAVSFNRYGRLFYLDPGEFRPKVGDFVLVPTDEGTEVAECVWAPEWTDEDTDGFPKLVGLAGTDDLRRDEQIRRGKADAKVAAKRLIRAHELPMKVVAVDHVLSSTASGASSSVSATSSAFSGSSSAAGETASGEAAGTSGAGAAGALPGSASGASSASSSGASPGGSSGAKTTIYFTAPHRVDFRALVRDLGATLRCRVELRQLSARDSARVQGGIGSCGRDLCCATFLTDFEPVTIRMAKDQDLPLNPMRISGACGRLMCCLKYEHPLYQQFQATAPAVGERVTTPEGPGRVVAHSVPRDAVTVRLDADGSRCSCSKASVCGSRQAYESRPAT
jgi:cell fate regulator YaaT (PSP1 superfamily)